MIRPLAIGIDVAETVTEVRRTLGEMGLVGGAAVATNAKGARTRLITTGAFDLIEDRAANAAVRRD